MTQDSSGEEALLEKIRKDTDLTIWLLFLLALVLSSSVRAEHLKLYVVVQSIVLVLDSIAITIFVFRQNWIRAFIWFLFIVSTISALADQVPF